MRQIGIQTSHLTSLKSGGERTESGILISLGAVAAVLATSLQSGVKKAASGTYKFGKGVAKVLSKLGPVFSALGSALLAVLKIGSNALMWLSSNFWVLLVALVFLLWNRNGSRDVRRK